MTTIEENKTKPLDILDKLDLNLYHTIQSYLTSLYHTFPLLNNTLFGIPLGNLISAILVLLFFLFLRRFFTYIVTETLQKFTKKTNIFYDDKITSSLKGPINFGFIVIGFYLFFVLIFNESSFIKNILNTLIIFNIFWALIAVTDTVSEILYKSTVKLHSELSIDMRHFILKIIKAFIGIIGFAAILQVWGINISALIASLGIGGLAFALAAKDTASNFFGSLALLLDRSIGVGEWIKVGNVEGVVEEIGMRTTKIRSFQKSLITMPNQIVATTPIENFSRRGIRRIKLSVGLDYDTNREQVVEIVKEIRTMLQTHKDISQKDTLLVNFESFSNTALNIFVYAFTSTANWDEYLNIREDIHLKIMQIIEKNNAKFAFLSQSSIIQNNPNLIDINT